MISLEVNGKKHEIEASSDVPLLWVLREHLGLTGTKYGCGKSLCGACTVHESFGSIVAQVAEVSVNPAGRVHVHKVVCAVDCGIVVNPEIVKAQMESGIVFGLSAVLHGAITFKEGRVEQGNFIAPAVGNAIFAATGKRIRRLPIRAEELKKG